MNSSIKQVSLAAFTSLVLAACGASGSSSASQDSTGSDVNTSLTAITDAAEVNTSSTLTEEQKYALAYMWHEEKLAYDIYLALNEVQPAMQLKNIATKSESQHMLAVETLVQAYDINITNLKDYTVNYSESELHSMESGTFALPEVQEFYDTLYAKGIKTQQDALEVGCMVEVTDVNDLNKYIKLFDNNSDVVTQFKSLCQESYNHYWAFNTALNALGVFEGCCSLGETYCKTVDEYPSSKH